MSNLMPMPEGVDDQYDLAVQMASEGRTAVPGMSYEEGVAAALGWVLGHTGEFPIDEEDHDDE